MNRSRISIGWWLTLLLCWGGTWWHLSTEWSLNPAYKYGFGTPILFLILAARRWPGTFTQSESNRGWISALIVGSWGLLLAGEMLRWLDPVWRLTGGLLMLGCIGLTAAFFLSTGGWPLLRREWFPLAFVWLGLPWPSELEQVISATLLQGVIATTMEMTEWIGIVAVQHGTVIELRHALVGMEEACSGIESLQATLMVTLFLGDYFHLTAARRFILWLGGSAICLATNLARIFALILIGNASSQARLDQFHDPSGLIASLVNFVFIYCLARRLQTVPAEWPLWTPFSWPDFRPLHDILLVGAFVAIPLFSFTCLHHVEREDNASTSRPHWSFLQPPLPAGWQAAPVTEPKGLRALLRHSQWEAYDLTAPDGHPLRLVHLFWKAGQVTSRNAFVHTPDVCMPNAGWTPRSSGSVRLRLNEQPIVFKRHDFTREPLGSVTVLQAFTGDDDACAQPTADAPTGRFARLQNLWRAPMHQVHEELLLYFPNCPPDALPDRAQAVLDLIQSKR